MAYGIVEYDDSGKPICEICGKAFHRVVSHVRKEHGIPAIEYKRKFGFDSKKGICSRESAERSKMATLSNYHKCISVNLEERGKAYRFKKGDKGRTKDKMSEQTRLRLKERLKDPEMKAKMQEVGTNLGKSGLGNQKRWGTPLPE